MLPGVPQKQAAFCAERGPPLSPGQKEVFLHKRQEQDNSYPSAGDRVGKAEAGASGQTARSVPVQVSPASRRGKSAAAFPANTAAGLRKSALQVCSPGLLYLRLIGDEKLYYKATNNYKQEQAFFFYYHVTRKNSSVCSTSYIRERIVEWLELEAYKGCCGTSKCYGKQFGCKSERN